MAPTLRILKPAETEFPTPDTSATLIALHYDHHDGGEYGVTIDGNHYSDLVACHEAYDISPDAGSLIKLAADLAVCANKGTLTVKDLAKAATACGFPLIHI